MARILLVEDYASLQKIYQTALVMKNHIVDVANDGQEALDKVNSGNYDLIVLDILLPNKSGVEFLKEFKPKEHKPPVMVIAMSNVPNPDILQEAVKLGADKFLSKPTLTPKELVKEADALLASNTK